MNEGNKKLLMLKPNQLLTHPRNMRRFYPSEQVREMANSIAASDGVIEPLVITKDQKSDKYLVVDGNMRLAGARLLGDKCPSLECKVLNQTSGDQLLSMVIANQVRYDVDPVSEGLHYKTLQDEGLSTREVSRRTGVHEIRIANRRLLADLDEPIQKLISEDKLPADPRVARALLDLTPAVRVKLATRLAQNPNIKIKTILSACERLLHGMKPTKKLKRPAVELSGALQSINGKRPIADVRAAAQKVCHGCNQYEGKLRDNPEPAWSMVVHAADETCNGCSLKEVQTICGSCPAVDLLRKLIRGSANGG